MANNITFDKINDLTGQKGVIGVNLGGSARIRDSLSVAKNINVSENLTARGTFGLYTGTTVNDLSTDGTLADNSDNSLVTEKAIKTYVDTLVTAEDLWDRDSGNGYTYLKNTTDSVGFGTSTPSATLHVDNDTTDKSFLVDHDINTTSAGTYIAAHIDVDRVGTVSTGTDVITGLDVDVNTTGASGGTISSVGLDIDVTGDTGGTSKAYGIDVNVSGADVNYAALFNGGFVGIGLTTPAGSLDILHPDEDGYGLYVARNYASANRPLIYFLQDNASDSNEAIGIKQDGTGTAVDVTNGNTGKSLELDHNVSGDSASNVTACHIDFDRTVATSGTNAHNDIGIDLDVTSASLGTSTLKGMDIDVVGATSGTSVATGIDVTVGSADKNYAAVLNGGNVGIGTSTPIATLHISDTLAGSGANPSVKIETTSDDSATSPELWLERVSTTPADDDYVGMIRFYGTNSDTDDGAGTEAQHQYGYMYVQATDITTTSEDSKMYFGTYKDGSAGTPFVIDKHNVGIGTTTPETLLHLSSATADKPDIIIENISTSQQAGGDIKFRNADTNTNLGDNIVLGEVIFQGWNITGSDWETAARITCRKDGATGGDDDMGGELAFYTTADGSSTSTTQRMCILNSGNVGIGNTAPAYPLDVTGDTRIGWHGYSTIIKVLPTDFRVNDDYARTPNVVEDDTADTLGFRLGATTEEAYAFVAIPNGYKATHVQVHASASTADAVQILSFNYTTGGTVNVGTTFALNANDDISDVSGTTTNDLVIKYIGASTSTIVYGATVTIAPI